MAVNWSPNASISLNTIVKAGTTQYSGFHFKCTTAGTSGSSEPDWPTTLGNTVIDGSVTWVAISSLYGEINNLEPDPFIDLFELRPLQNLHNTTTPIRWHNGANEAITGSVVYAGLTYNRIAIEATGFEKASTGTIPRPKLTVSNTDTLVSLLLNQVNTFNQGNDLCGCEVRRIRTTKEHLTNGSDPDNSITAPYEIWIIDRKESENMNTVTFELTCNWDRPNAYVPKRQLIGNCCQWQYRSSECSYAGSNYFDKNDNAVSSLANDVCGKRLSSCKARFGANNPLPFGSFPLAGRTQ